MAKTKDDFHSELEYIFEEATKLGIRRIEIRAGDLHRRVGMYPGPDHRMPICCQVMRNMMKEGDEITRQPEKGNGANFDVMYCLPRENK